MRLGKNPRLVAENREFDKTGEEEEHEKRFAQNHESFELRGFKSSAGSCAAAKSALPPTAGLVCRQSSITFYFKSFVYYFY